MPNPCVQQQEQEQEQKQKQTLDNGQPSQRVLPSRASRSSSNSRSLTAHFLLLCLLVLVLSLAPGSEATACVYPSPSHPAWSNLVTCPEHFKCLAEVGGSCEFQCTAGYEPKVKYLTCTNPDEWNDGADLRDNCQATDRGPNAAMAIVFLVLTMPLGITCTIMFYRRRHIQPLKARQPILMVMACFMFLLWILLLCVQRLVNDSYPCWLQLWTGYLGVLVLANVYMIRCFILYANFVQTSRMVEIQKQIEERQRDKMAKKRQLSQMRDLEAGETKSDLNLKFDANGDATQTFTEEAQLTIKRYRKFMKQNVLSYFTIAASAILLLPAIIVTAKFEDLRCWVGDGCLLHWHGAALALAMYCGVYLLIFLFVALKIRGKIDAFGIKTELKFVGLGGIVCLIPWWFFNNVESLQKINDEVFPFSTLFNIIGVLNALLMGTAYPLWLSYHRPPVIEKPRNSKIDTLEELLADPRGFESFKKFLTTEFSVENALFWKDVENFRAYVRRVQDMADDHKMDEISRLAWASRRLYQDYVQPDGALEVNLPANIVNDLDEAYKDIKADMDRLAQLTQSDKCYGLANLILAKFGGPHPEQPISLLEDALADEEVSGGAVMQQPSPDYDSDDFLDEDDDAIPMSKLDRQSSARQRKSKKKKKKKGKGKGKRDRKARSTPQAPVGPRTVPVHGMFDAAQDNIFQLMQRDSEPRYRRSEIYDSLVTTIRNEQEDHQNRAMLDMT